MACQGRAAPRTRRRSGLVPRTALLPRARIANQWNTPRTTWTPGLGTGSETFVRSYVTSAREQVKASVSPSVTASSVRTERCPLNHAPSSVALTVARGTTSRLDFGVLRRLELRGRPGRASGHRPRRHPSGPRAVCRTGAGELVERRRKPLSRPQSHPVVADRDELRGHRLGRGSRPDVRATCRYRRTSLREEGEQ
jgi:hypothetical protein